jgi:CheY-like chemotaxis protein
MCKVVLESAELEAAACIKPGHRFARPKPTRPNPARKLPCSYDVILCDVHMPEMDGLEAAARIKQTCRPAPTIIAVTAAALQEERQQCLNAGMDL